MVSEWEIVSLDQISEIIDSRHKTPKYSLSGLPMVRVVDVKGGALSLSETKRVSEDVYNDFSKGRSPEIGDLIISRVGSCGNVSYVSSTEKFCLGQNTAFIIPKDNGRFLYYCLISTQVKQQMENMAVGAVQKTISLKNIKSLQIPYPPFNEREGIASFLSTLDDKITLNRQINQTLEQMAHALFKSWFVDFDPVIDNALDAGNPIPDALAERAALRQTVRASDVFQPLPDDVRQLFPNEFEESELGWVPKGWENRTLHDLVESKSVTYPLKNVEEVVFLNTGDIENGRFLHRNISKVDGLPGQAKKSIRRNDILFSEIRPKNKRFAFVNFDAEEYVVSTKLMVLRAKNTIEPELPYFLLTLEKTTDELQRVAELRSGTFPQITFSELAFINFTLPLNSVLIETFVSQTLKPFYKRAFQLTNENDLLESLRDTLLPRLISGELRLDSPEVEKAKSLAEAV